MARPLQQPQQLLAILRLCWPTTQQQAGAGAAALGTAAAGVLLRRGAAFSSSGSCHDAAGGSGSQQRQPAAATRGLLHPGVFTQTCRVAGKPWKFEAGRLASLADGACLVTVGGTSVLSTAVVSPEPQLLADGVPLQVEYRERYSAVGRMPSRPDRRERQGSDREVLAARLIDRALRPLLPPGFLYETQVWCQVLSADGYIEPEVVAINAASAALLLARNIPFTHPIGATKVYQSHAGSRWAFSFARAGVGSSSRPPQVSLAYAGSPAKATAIEATCSQASDASFVQALQCAARATAPLIRAQHALAAEVAAAAGGRSSKQLPMLWPSTSLQEAVAYLAKEPLTQLFTQHSYSSSSGGSGNKSERAASLTALQWQLLADMQRLGLMAEGSEQVVQSSGAAGSTTSSSNSSSASPPAGMHAREDVLRAFDTLQSQVMRQVLLQQRQQAGSSEAGPAAASAATRVDGRGLSEVRAVAAAVGPLPRAVHGSGLFTRGETQSLASATVGHDTDVPPAETLFKRRPTNRLHLHYSFPPFSVGEVAKPGGGPNRREVGHANLARAGLIGLMPSEEDFPFTVRVTADTLSSSGSSSMAAVCAGSLALAAAGVPMASLAAGISVGLVTARPPQLGVPGFDAASLVAGSSQSSSSSQGSGFPSDYSSFVAVREARLQADSSSDSNEDGSSSSSSSDSSSSEADEPAVTPDAGDSSSSDSTGVLLSSYGPSLLLTDIQGIEDHLGDMDFKIAGTSRGITAVQLDTKLPGVDLALLEAALAPAAAARQQLLAAMAAALAEYESATPGLDLPQFGAVQIMKELVPRLIGPQGSTLMEIEDTCGASLIVEDTGTVNVYAPTQMRYQHALAAVQEVEGRNVVAGEVYRVRVLKVVDFGAYVALPNGLPALLHISELSHEKIREVRDVVAEGQEFDVLCKGRDAKGFVQLSLKDLLPKPAKEGEEGEEGGEGGGPSTAGGGSLREAAAAAAAAAAAIREQQQQVEEQQSGRPLQHHVHHQSTGGPAAGHRGGSSTGSSSSRTPRAHVWRRSDNNQQGEE